MQHFIATDYVELDASLRGGLPRGFLVELAAQRGSSPAYRAFVLDCIAAAQRAGLVVALVDADASLDMADFAARGGNPAGLVVSQPEAPEHVWEILTRLTRSLALDLIVVWGSAKWGEADRALSQSVNTLHAAIWQGRGMPSSSGTTVLACTEQPLQAVKYYASVRLMAAPHGDTGLELKLVKATAAAGVGAPLRGAVFVDTALDSRPTQEA